MCFGGKQPATLLCTLQMKIIFLFTPMPVQKKLRVIIFMSIIFFTKTELPEYRRIRPDFHITKVLMKLIILRERSFMLVVPRLDCHVTSTTRAINECLFFAVFA